MIRKFSEKVLKVPFIHLEASEYKDILIMVQYVSASFTVSIAKFIYEIFFGILNVTVFIPLWLGHFTSFVLIKRGKYYWAKVTLVLISNFTIYIVEAEKGPSSGTIIYFTCLIPYMIIWFYNSNRSMVFFLILTLATFIFTFFTEFYEYGEENLNSFQSKVGFFMTTILSLLAIIYLIFYLLQLNNKVEANLRNKNRLLEKRNKELDSFVYSTSHDLRAPLRSLLGLVMIAHKTGWNKDLNEILQMMENRIYALDKFIQDIIDYSRNLRVDSVKKKFLLKPLVYNLIENVKYSNKADNIQFLTNIKEDDFMYTDYNRLKIVLSNLIYNAIRYHDYEKSYPSVSVNFSRQNGSYKIIVKDNGKGIDKWQQKKIFDMFYRGSEESEGSGLGLYIVKESVDKMGGKIYLQSELNKGSTFTVDLPVN